mmetsp:Transcript_89717/g.200797  ORF Transcript_89717/g.200797 Transcript_89717/m.200797 type:complete len:215 (-) Transcript_89717:363-1007(-)
MASGPRTWSRSSWRTPCPGTSCSTRTASRTSCRSSRISCPPCPTCSARSSPARTPRTSASTPSPTSPSPSLAPRRRAAHAPQQAALAADRHRRSRRLRLEHSPPLESPRRRAAPARGQVIWAAAQPLCATAHPMGPAAPACQQPAWAQWRLRHRGWRMGPSSTTGSATASSMASAERRGTPRKVRRTAASPAAPLPDGGRRGLEAAGRSDPRPP